MQLSKRLKTAADFVTSGNTVADIGCDHAYISIYLAGHNIARHVIAMDINEGPLARARENILRYGMQDRIETRLSDGIKALECGEAETLFLAGMGGGLMIRILEGNRAVTEQAGELILQPQSEIEAVRRWIHRNGFAIQDEGMLMEDGRYYTVIKAEKLQDRHNDAYPKRCQYLFGRILLEREDSCLRQYLYDQEKKYRFILKQMERNGSEDSRQRFQEIKEEYGHILEAEAYYGPAAVR